MKYNDNITVYREYKNLYDTKTLLIKIIHIECEMSDNTKNTNKNAALYDNFLYPKHQK